MALLHGKSLAEKILAETRARIVAARVVPGLAAIRVGEDASSCLYIEIKKKAARACGIHFEQFIFSASAEQADIRSVIAALNIRPDIHGIIVQLPLPLSMNTDEIIATIDPKKDADGFQDATVARFLAGEREACPVFPRALVTLLRLGQQGYARGERGLALVNSRRLGRVLAQALALEGLTSRYLLSNEPREKIAIAAKEARVILTACGIPNLLTGDMLANGAIVIDGGITRGDEGTVVGDAERLSVEQKAQFLSPVPGGVGPVTVATLLARVTELAIAHDYS